MFFPNSFLCFCKYCGYRFKTINRRFFYRVIYLKRKALVVIEIPIKLEKKKIDNILGLFQNVLDELKKDKQLGKYTHRNSALQGTQTIEKDGIITVRVTLITKINPKFNVKRKYNYPLLKELEKQKVALG